MDNVEPMAMKARCSGVLRVLRATGYSFAGLSAAWRHEAAFREELLLSLVLVPMAFWLGDSHLERVALIGCLALVLVVELLNSAIEAVVDDIHGEQQHPLAGRAKDMASAAVFVSLCLAGFVWLGVIFGA